MDNIDKRRKEKKSKNNTSNNVGTVIIFPFMVSFVFNWGFGLINIIGLIISIIVGLYYSFNNEKMESFSDDLFSIFKKNK